MFSILDYRCVVALHEERSFVRAAEALGLSQPALTARLRRMEEQLEVRLFDRGRRGAEPTPAGTAFVEAARQIVELAEQSLDVARDANRGLGQYLRLGMTQIAAVQVAVPILTRFRQANPFARLRLTEGTSAGLERLVEQNLIDLAFLHPPIHHAGLSEHHLMSQPLARYDGAPGTAERRPTIRYTRKDAPVMVAELDRQDRGGAEADALVEVDTALGAMVLSHAGYGPCVVPARYPSPFATSETSKAAPTLDLELGTSVVWRSLDRRPMVVEFLRICRTP